MRAEVGLYALSVPNFEGAVAADGGHVLCVYRAAVVGNFFVRMADLAHQRKIQQTVPSNRGVGANRKQLRASDTHAFDSIVINLEAFNLRDRLLGALEHQNFTGIGAHRHMRLTITLKVHAAIQGRMVLVQHLARLGIEQLPQLATGQQPIAAEGQKVTQAAHVRQSLLVFENLTRVAHAVCVPSVMQHGIDG